MTLDIKTVSKFVAIRNASEFNSNLQFQIDLKETGIDVRELPKAEKKDEGWFEWDLGFCRMIEQYGIMSFIPTP